MLIPNLLMEKTNLNVNHELNFYNHYSIMKEIYNRISSYYTWNGEQQ